MPGSVLETGITSARRGCIGLNELNIVTRREGVLISKAVFLFVVVVVLFLIRQWNSNCYRLVRSQIGSLFLRAT